MVQFRTAATCLLTLLSCAEALNPIEVQSQDFVDSVTKERFVIIGIDYQPGGQSAYTGNNGDPLSDSKSCLRDAAMMQQLGINTIRTYNVDPTANHDDCAAIFNAVGIYMLIDVNSPLSGQSLDRTNPSGTYTSSYLNHIFGVVESFMNYPNTLGFFAGNEIINDVPSAQKNPPYIRAVQRDLKAYIANHAPRTIPVGYSAADVATVLTDTWNYFQCDLSSNGGNDTSRSDFFGLNDYEWCGPDATFTSSGYDVLVSTFASTTIPVFFSEYGCNTPAPRVFNEVLALYGPQMTVLSGGLIYEWSQEGNDFGLVTINSNGSMDLGDDYNTLQGQYNKLNVTLLESSNSTADSLTPPTCSSGLISNSGFSKSFNIPDTPSGAVSMISNGISNPNTGKAVAVGSTSVTYPVFKTNGEQIQNLVIQEVNGSNTPDGANTDAGVSGTPTSSGGAAATSSGAATRLDMSVGSGSLLALLFGIGFMGL